MKYPSELKKGANARLITAYDAFFAALVVEAGLDGILVGDSLGNMVQGHTSTLPVTVDDIIYHTRMVVRGAPQCLVIADMPFMSVEVNTDDALRAAGRLVKEGGATAVKVETHFRVIPAMAAMIESGIPVIGHVGLTPQWVNMLGGYRQQGRGMAAKGIHQLVDELVAIGVSGIVLEHVPAALGTEITRRIPVPTIGVGAGPDCDAQLAVLHDVLGLTAKLPSFMSPIGDGRKGAIEALHRYKSVAS